MKRFIAILLVMVLLSGTTSSASMIRSKRPKDPVTVVAAYLSYTDNSQNYALDISTSVKMDFMDITISQGPKKGKLLEKIKFTPAKNIVTDYTFYFNGKYTLSTQIYGLDYNKSFEVAYIKVLNLKEEEKTLKVKGTYSIKTDAIDYLKYESSNKKVAKVNSKGKVTAVGKGTAIITVSEISYGATNTITITVK